MLASRSVELLSLLSIKRFFFFLLVIWVRAVLVLLEVVDDLVEMLAIFEEVVRRSAEFGSNPAADVATGDSNAEGSAKGSKLVATLLSEASAFLDLCKHDFDRI